jgi:hypothetical protein
VSRSAVRLQPVTLRLQRVPGPLTPQIERALAIHGDPLRWAITAVEPGEEQQLTGSVLLIEAVVLA